MQELLIATKNIGKYKEICEALIGMDFKISFLKDFDFDDADFVEDGETFEDNALKKAKYYFDKFAALRGNKDFFVLGEDSGIIVEALNGELGVKTRRWGAGEAASDEEWLDYFLNRMRGESNKKAEFVCFACLLGADCCEIFEGRTFGNITDEAQGHIYPGIPLSSCFVPDGLEEVYSELSVEEKNRVSHRGKAMAKLAHFLKLRSNPDPIFKG